MLNNLLYSQRFIFSFHQAASCLFLPIQMRLSCSLSYLKVLFLTGILRNYFKSLSVTLWTQHYCLRCLLTQHFSHMATLWLTYYFRLRTVKTNEDTFCKNTVKISSVEQLLQWRILWKTVVVSTKTPQHVKQQKKLKNNGSITHTIM